MLTDIKRPKILIIDDDKEYVNNLIFLINGSYQFKTVESGREGLELLKIEAFNLLILDLNMPAYFARDNEDEGIEVLRKIRSRQSELNPKLPVIILTGSTNDAKKKLCSKFKTDSYFIKPPDIHSLKIEIDKALKIN